MSRAHPKTILVASCKADHPMIDPVIEALRAKNNQVIVYESDLVASGESELGIRLRHGKARVSYKNQELDLSDIAAAWYRRPNDFGLQGEPLKAFSLDREYQELQRFLWQSISEQVWLNDPGRMRRAENKLMQLVVASEVGFDTPDTVVSNAWPKVTALQTKSLILKMPHRGSFFMPQGDLKVLYSTKVKNDPQSLPLDTLPYPGLWQPFVPKKREWRITVVGKQLFSTAIYTGGEAKEDWRKHQNDQKAVHSSKNYSRQIYSKSVLHF